MKLDPEKALVVLSGGQDSVTCLGYALSRFTLTTAIAFNYGQRHAIELECATRVCELARVPLRVVDIDALRNLVPSALTGVGSVSAQHELNRSLPASFVPVRNALFLTLAHGYAQAQGIGTIITGVCQTDYSGYPDCRRDFIDALEYALSLGYLAPVRIETPLMYLDKAQTFAFAEQHGFLDVVLEHSHTCYEGNHTTRHPWGYGCGECPACRLRANGWNVFASNR